MTPERQAPHQDRSSGTSPEDLGHPRGTLVIVILFGLLFALGWLAFYFRGFLARGAPHP